MNNNIKTILFIVFTAIVVHEMSKTTTTIKECEKVSVIKPKPQKKVDSIIVTATMYYPVVGQCDNDPLVTASMRVIDPNKASEHKWIAMSRDLLKRWGGKFEYKQKVRLIGCGVKDGIYTIADCMNKRFTNKIDILETQGTPLYKFENVKIVKL